jgi:hypothetical protein
MFTLLPKGVQKKLILFLLKFAICHLKRSKWDTQGRGGSLIHEKNMKSKISWHCPFKEADS